MVQEYGVPPQSQNSLDYAGALVPLKPGGVFGRAPTTSDTNYPIGFEWLYQVSSNETDIYCRVPDSTVWQFIESTSGGIVPVDEGGTGVGTITDHAIMVGQGTDPIATVGPGTAGETAVYTSNTADPVMVPISGGTGEGWANLGMSLAGGVLSIVSEDGTAISSTNPAYVKFNSRDTPGVIKTIAVTTPPAGLTATQLTSATFGTTAATAWAEAMPFFLYAVMNTNETSLSFFISRNPCSQITPATVYKAGTVASVTSQYNFFGLDSAATSADYASQACVRVGSFRMVKSAGDAWTIQTLGSGNGGVGDGIGNYDENTYWVFPAGQNGAAANTYFSNADTTNPIFGGSGQYNYQLGNDGSVDTLLTFTLITTDGVGASNPLRIHLPASSIEGNSSSPPGYFRTTTNVGQTQNFAACLRNNTGSGNYYNLVWLASAVFTGGEFLVAEDLTSTYVNPSLDITYQAFVGYA